MRGNFNLALLFNNMPRIPGEAVDPVEAEHAGGTPDTLAWRTLGFPTFALYSEDASDWPKLLRVHDHISVVYEDGTDSDSQVSQYVSVVELMYAAQSAANEFKRYKEWTQRIQANGCMHHIVPKVILNTFSGKNRALAVGITGVAPQLRM